MMRNERTHTAIIASSANVLLGLWLFVSVFIFFPEPQALWNDVIVGLGVALIAVSRLFGAARDLSWTNFLFGIWLILGGWVLEIENVWTLWNDLWVGCAIVVLASMSALSGARTGRDLREPHQEVIPPGEKDIDLRKAA